MSNRRLVIDALEDRIVLAGVTVGNALDLVNAPDVTSIAALIADDGGDGISLREAITAANSQAGADTITFDPSVFIGGSASLIRLGGTELSISDSLIIDGSTGIDVVITADANGDDLTVGATGITDVVNNSNTSDNSRVLVITAGDTTIRGLTITGGFGTSVGGGGILSNSAGMVTIDHSTVSGNAHLSSGGGIYASVGTLAITSSTISKNSSGLGGGGIFAIAGTTTISGSTVSGNSAGSAGGGIFSLPVLPGQFTTIANSTISGNTASGGHGGGIYNFNGLTEITSSTITANLASGGLGSGVASRGLSGVRTEVSNSIIAGNTNRDVAVVNGRINNSFQSYGFNLIGTGSTSSTANGGTLDGLANFHQFGDQTGIVNPLLGPLADNGGPTLTHALLSGSLAINTGDPAAVAGVGDVPLVDQRGSGFDRVVGGRIDIGAVEEQLAESASLIVTTNADVVDGFDFETSLREAILFANTANAETITFDPSVFTGGGASLIRLDGTELFVKGTLTIDGLTGTDVVITADANDDDLTIGASEITDVVNNSNTSDNSRVFRIAAGNATLRGLTITGGFTENGSVNSGGGIRSDSSTILTLDQSTISGNASLSRGGGIFADSGVITITSSTISKNSAVGDGGGIHNLFGAATIISSTVSGNSSTGDGGGIYTREGSTTITSSTISGNSVNSDGGGVYTVESTTTISTSTISGNSVNRDGGGVFARYGTTVISSSSINGNSAYSGGGVHQIRGTLTVTSSAISENSADANSGGIYVGFGTATIASSIVSGNSAGFNGGGVDIRSSVTTITSSTISGNSVNYSGGGIFSTSNASTTTITYSTISGNSAGQRGGGILVDSGSTTTISSSTISGNSGGAGGGIFTDTNLIDLTTTISNSTISNNTATSGQGGGVFNNRGLTLIQHSTITANMASTDQGSGVASYGNDTRTEVTNSVIAGNTNEDVAVVTFAVTNSFQSNGFNLIGTGGGRLDGLANFDQPGDQTGIINPLLGPLADNGGPTLTHALLPGSPAIDAGDPTILFDANEFDQRGIPLVRVFGPVVDIGAFELQPRAEIGGPYSGDEGSPIALNGSASTMATLYDWDLDNDGQYDDATGENVNFVPTDNGVFTVGLRINGPGGPTDSTSVTVGNLPPTAGVAGPSNGVPFQPRSFTLTATDPSSVDQTADFSFDIDWNGDSIVDETIIGPSGTLVDHAFPSVGNKTVRVTATDKDGGTSIESTHSINIVRVQQQGTDLVWGGTTGADAVEFEETATETVEIRVTLLNGVVVNDTQTFVGVSGRLIAYGGDGSDIIDAGGPDGLINISATLIGGLGDDTIYGGDAADIIRGDAEGDGSEGKDVIDGGGGDDLIYGDGMEGAADTIMGGDGNDTIYGDNGDISGDGAEGHDVIYGDDGDDMLYGGRRNDTIFGGNGNDTIDGQTGNDILSGGSGNDTLIGGDGKDLLFAGSGADTLHGGADGDLLVAGATSFDSSEAELKLIGNEWRLLSSYATQIANISGNPGGANEPAFLQPGVTVFDDAEVDTLFGEGGTDWFLDNQSGLIPDILSDLESGEVETDIAP